MVNALNFRDCIRKELCRAGCTVVLFSGLCGETTSLSFNYLFLTFRTPERVGKQIAVAVAVVFKHGAPGYALSKLNTPK